MFGGKSSFVWVGLLGLLLTVTSVWAQECAPVPEGLVSWWPGEWDDSDIWSGNSGTLIGGVSFPNGKVGKAFSFGGAGGGVLIDGNPVGLRLQDLTIEAWIRRASPRLITHFSPNSRAVLFGYYLGGYHFGLMPPGLEPTETDSGRLIFGKSGGPDVNSGSSMRVTDTAFYHVAVTKSGNNVVFYRNGIASEPRTLSTNFTFDTDPTIGSWGNYFAWVFLGLIDELSIYDRALTLQEINAIYEAGEAGKCRPK